SRRTFALETRLAARAIGVAICEAVFSAWQVAHNLLPTKSSGACAFFVGHQEAFARPMRDAVARGISTGVPDWSAGADCVWRVFCANTSVAQQSRQSVDARRNRWA